MNIYVCVDLSNIWNHLLKIGKTSSFREFYFDQRKNYKHLRKKELFSQMGKEWRIMSSKEKKPYIERADRKKSFYLNYKKKEKRKKKKMKMKIIKI